MFPSWRKTRGGDEVKSESEEHCGDDEEESMAIPAESYPRYSNRLKPLNSTCKMYLLSLLTL